MPATKLSEIKNIAEAVERALGATHAALGGKPTLPRSDEDNDELWTIANFNLGPAADHRFKRPDGEFDYDMYRDCVIEWELFVPRVGALTRETFAATYTLLAQEVTRIRLAMDPARWGAINAQLAHHHLTKLVPLGTVQGFDSDRGEDRATVRFGCWVGIKPDAWPTDLTAYTNPTL
jgi:hypothetical protein